MSLRNIHTQLIISTRLKTVKDLDYFLRKKSFRDSPFYLEHSRWSFHTLTMLTHTSHRGHFRRQLEVESTSKFRRLNIITFFNAFSNFDADISTVFIWRRKSVEKSTSKYRRRFAMGYDVTALFCQSISLHECDVVRFGHYLYQRRSR